MSIKIENIETYGWEAAARGMRNPKNSWDMSDSEFADCCHNEEHQDNCPSCFYFDGFNRPCKPHIGENDLKLMHTLAKAGSDHGKFLRMITVTMDITAPLYWWKEFDTYKVGTVANSCSTMYTSATRDPSIPSATAFCAGSIPVRICIICSRWAIRRRTDWRPRTTCASMDA